jgi:serine/threonine protein phosphatase 1
MEEQRGDDLRWIRAGFLEHERCHGAMIVHGHTITDEPDFRTNRIGIDTGAYRTGRLTALGLEGGERWLLATPAEDADPA